jgi:hypothetical protein
MRERERERGGEEKNCRRESFFLLLSFFRFTG